MRRTRTLFFLIPALVMVAFAAFSSADPVRITAQDDTGDEAVCLADDRLAFLDFTELCADGEQSACLGSGAASIDYQDDSLDNDDLTPGETIRLSGLTGVQTSPTGDAPENLTLLLLDIEATLTGEGERDVVKLLLIGEIALENGVVTSEAPDDFEPFTLAITDGANVREIPQADGPLVGSFLRGTEVQISGINESGTWLFVSALRRTGWMLRDVVPNAPELDTLPVLNAGNGGQPLQEFTFESGDGRALDCAGLPGIILLQAPPDTTATLIINGAEIRFEGTIIARTTSSSRMRVHAIDGVIYLPDGTIPAGFSMRIELDDEGTADGQWGGFRPLSDGERVWQELIVAVFDGETLHYLTGVPTPEQITNLLVAFGADVDDSQDGDEDEIAAQSNGSNSGGADGPDSDGDGIPDTQDRCPALAGDASNSGCPPQAPDSDGDGIDNGDDRCPNDAGPAETQGCPTTDSDGDGVIDVDDACPNDAGPAEFGGCPDSDGDGVPDIRDQCPVAPGSPNNAGCAENDFDRDGWDDAIDLCPTTYGNVEGCPDADGDGIPEPLDDCPNTFGVDYLDGCPDTDGDGEPDSADQCPTVPGYNNGCPDEDGDGVFDDVDACPQDAGPAADQGCPDSDGDGLANHVDSCPGDPGPPNNGGCSVSPNDSDSDDVPDSIDDCPDLPGEVELNGCPRDTDDDGLYDEYGDECPAEAGPANLNGCPDSDGDGLIDEEDSCPSQQGPANNNGCPRIVEDSDGDGWIDSDDDCPIVWGTARGCPDDDGDGITNEDDACPEESGPSRANGCPDEDRDGVPDSSDQCPFDAGPANLNGCPDSDGDGIVDSSDNCPFDSGPASNGGCPLSPTNDRDDDGLDDDDDLCPSDPGPEEFGGCPDSDGDGVPDNYDQCPAVPGDISDGCPVD